MNDDSSQENDLVENLGNLAKDVVTLLPKFRNLRKVYDRLLGDVSDVAFDALVARLRRSQIHSQKEIIRTMVDDLGFPPSIAYEMVSRQEALDTLACDALVRITQDEKNNTGPTAETETSSDVSDDEWFDVYRREATDRSAGEMREAFVRILAGEIRQPGTFSVQTLRVLGTISTASAKKFRRAASVCMRLELGEISDARVPEVGGNLGTNCLQDVGLSFDVLTQLEEDGLLHSNYSNMSYGPIHEATNSREPLPPDMQLPFRYQDRKWILRGTSDELKKKALKVRGATFSTAGRELLKVVEIESMPEFTERLKTHFAKEKYEMVEVPEDVDAYPYQ